MYHNKTLNRKNIIILLAILLFALLSWQSQVFSILPFAYKTWKLPSASNAISFSSDGTMLATGAGKPGSYKIAFNSYVGGVSSTVEIRRVADGEVIQTLKFPNATSIAFTGGDGKVRFWKMPPRNYSRFWIFGGICFAALVYWQRTSLINWVSR